MAENSDDLERLSREQLILKARVLGIERPELMTRVEMRDEIVRRSEPDIAQQKRARGFLGVARDLVASVVEAGLNLPDAAALIRGDGNRETYWKGPPPVATVTLAEIYAAQGHLERALRMLDEVLAKEPDHDPARALRTRLANATDLPVAPARRRQKISFAENSPINVPAPVPEPVQTAPEAEAESPAEPLTDHTAPVAPPVAETRLEAEPATRAEPAAKIPVSIAMEASAPMDAAASAQAAETTVAADLSTTMEASTEVAVSSPTDASSLAEAPELREPEPSLSEEPLPAVASAPSPSAEPLPEAPSLEAPVERAPEVAAESAAAPVPAPPAALLTLSLAGQRQIYWELPPASLAALRTRAPSGRPVVRVISFRARAGRVERRSSDLIPDAEVGFAVLPDLRADAVVRAVLGWEAEGRFMPYLVASDLPSGSPSARRTGPFRANPLVGAVAHEVEQRALRHCSRRPAH